MKKIIALALALLMVFALAACGSNDDSSAGATAKPSNSENNTNQQTNPTGEKTEESADHPVLKLCGLTVEDIEAGVTALGDSALETESAFVGAMTPAEFTFASFESWVNALAENCRKAAKDGKLYESEMSTEEVTSFSLSPDALMNIVQFIYRTNNKVIYVTASYATTGSAFSCKLDVY